MSGLSKLIGRGLALIAVCIVAGVSALSPAAAQSDPAERAFAMVTGRMEAARRVQFCAFVAQSAMTQAAEEPTPTLRASREWEARSLRARLAPHLERANASLSATDLQRIERENNEYMGLLSYAPSQEIGRRLNADPAVMEDFLGLWLSDIGSRCNFMLDAMGVAQVEVPDPPKMVIDR